MPSLFYKKIEGSLETKMLTLPHTLTDGSMEKSVIFIVDLFRTRVCHKFPLDNDIEEMLASFLISSFEQFCADIEQKYKDSIEEIKSWAEKWRNATIDLLKYAYEQAPMYKCQTHKHRSNIFLVKRSIQLVSELYTEYFENLPFEDFQDVSDTIMYNFWGSRLPQFQDGIKELVCPSENDLEKTDRFRNRLLFARRYDELISNILEENSDGNKLLNEFRDHICFLFRDYINRLNMKIPSNPELLKFATSFWKYTTKTILSNETYIGLNEYLITYSLKDSSQSESESACLELKRKIEDIYTAADKYVDYACDIFHNDFLLKKLNCPWSMELQKLNLQYRELFNAMKGTYFTGVKFEQFKYCFESADMSLLQERCSTSKEGAYGAIRYLVIRIGKKCPIWFKEVAKSLKNSKGVQYDHLTLARSVKDDKEFAKTFRELMIVNDIVLPK